MGCCGSPGGQACKRIIDVVVVAAGHRLMAELIFGSKLETIQATLPNPLVVVGPDCRARVESETFPAD